jgi:acyl carrier protein
MDAIAARVKQYILDEFLPGEDPANLTDTTPLVTGGILDSLATLKLVSFLEQEFGIKVASHETGQKFLNTLEAIATLVRSKQQAAAK